MWLLNTRSVTLKEFGDDETPEYVILSHTWEDEEVLYQDVVDGIENTKLGYRKVKGCCRRARQDGFRWIWIDTCCINKGSSVELSEAINSMFRYYKEAQICYAYLSDIASSEAEQLTTSRWFERGWTLQELIAPPIVEFYSCDWIDIGTKTSLRKSISLRTGIPNDVLLGADPSSCNIAERMSWASGRNTKRIEDQAYSLMGIFDVNMPMLYGEGIKAFQRLQREIFNQRVDYSIFAWSDHEWLPEAGIFANSPWNFTTSWSEQRQELHNLHLQKARLLHPGFSEVHIDDFRKLNPVNPYDLVPINIAHGRFPDDPPMFTSNGLRLKVLASTSHTYAQFIFLGLEYEGGYLCIAENNRLRHDAHYMFRCNREELMRMRYESIYFETAKTPKPRSFFEGVMNVSCPQWVRLQYEQPHQNYVVSLVSVCTSSTQGDAPHFHWTDKFIHKDKTCVFDVIVLKVARHSTETLLDVGDARITVIVGHDDTPWCVIRQSSECTEPPAEIYKSYLVESARSVALDRDACHLNCDIVVSATFRRHFGKDGGRRVAHILSVTIHEKNELPEWVRICLEESSPNRVLG
jgi:hypothetical protein